MNAFIMSLDNITPSKYGTNGHIEFTWSNHIKEQILQLNFQMVSVKGIQLSALYDKFKNILYELKNNYDNDKKESSDILCYLITLFKMIGYTRDIIDGKGEYQLTYMMIYIWSIYYPKLAEIAINLLLRTEKSHMLGSWKDIKLFCDYCKTQHTIDPNTNYKRMITFCIDLINYQLRKDLENYDKGLPISLAARWVPREKSKYGWLFKELAFSFFPEYFQFHYINSDAIKKSYTKYRQLCSKLNKYLDTVQIKQCENNWQSIDFNHVTSLTFAKQTHSFLEDKNNDRKRCADNFKIFLDKKIQNGKEINGKRISLDFFIKEARELLYKRKQQQNQQDTPPKLQTQINILNSLWKSQLHEPKTLQNFITMIDVSFSMDGLSKDIAIALGIRISEVSSLRNRIMTFGEHPNWLNLSNCPDFISKVDMITKCDWGGTSNFYSALDMIIDASIQSKLSHDEIQESVLVILSDMQINGTSDNSLKDHILVDVIRKKYEDIGITHYGKPLKPPHIILWNLRSTNGFPCLHFYENISMLSGYNTELLNSFCNKGLKGLNQFTPWVGLQNSLKNKRYDLLEIEADSYFTSNLVNINYN